MKIFLADLGHNQLTPSSDVYPLGVANLTAYASEYFRGQEPLDIKLYREPEDLKQALDSAAPDVLGLSNYAWNHGLSLSFARYAKRKDPTILTLMGGPNFPLTADERETFLREMPEIDVAVAGSTYEGEKAFLNIIERFSEVRRSLTGLQEGPVPGSIWVDRRSGQFVDGGEPERIRDLDEIPSPYLAGLMDPFFTTGYFPLLAITRGCPFTCAYCNSSVKPNSQVRRHSLANVRADLLYIAEHVRPEITLCLADDNFGMYRQDEEVADLLMELQDRFGWPQYVRTTTGKNNHERIIRVMRKTRGILPMTIAVQSLNPEVLKNIARTNIKLEAYREITKELQAQGMQAYGELILCLPGETKSSFMQSVKDLLRSGVSRISAHQLMLLHGAPLSNPENRQRFGFKSRFRVVARNIGNYLGEPAIETEEIVVETPTFSFQDYLETRVFHLLLTIYYYEGNFEESFELARQAGVEPFDMIVRMQQMLARAPEGMRRLIEEFLRESQEELFFTKEDCIAWAYRNFDSLLSGSVGGNLLSKYSMLGRFFATQDTLDFLEMVTCDAMRESTLENKAELLKTVMDYLRCVLLHSPFNQTLEDTPYWATGYDVDLWRQDRYAKSLAFYRYAEPVTFAAIVRPKQRALIKSRLVTFGEHPSGMGKFTRTMFARDLHRTLVRVEQTVIGAEHQRPEAGR